MRMVLLASTLAIGVCTITAAQAAPVLSSAADAASLSLSVASVLQADALLGSAADNAPTTYNSSADLLEIDQGAQRVAATLLEPLAAGEAVTSRAVTASAWAAGSPAMGTATIADAVHVSLSNYLLSRERISDDLILGHSEASVAGVLPAVAAPDPGTWAMMIFVLGMTGIGLRGRHRQALPLRA